MIEEIPIEEMPDWLASVEPNLGDLPLHELLHNSVYYPASGFDGLPVRWLAGNFHSFIYVDYGVTREQALAANETFEGGGYILLGCREVAPEELTSQSSEGLLFEHADNADDIRRIYSAIFRRLPLEPGDCNQGDYSEFIKPPFAIWNIFERMPDCSPRIGPKRFSLLYIGCDGVATFRDLYYSNKCFPSVIAIIQPGMNWTNFRDPTQILARSVLENPHGQPRYLLSGGYRNGADLTHFYQDPWWPIYSVEVRDHFLATEGNRLDSANVARLWKKRSEPHANR